MNYRQLVEDIAAKHGITIRWTAKRTEWAARGKRASIPPPIDDEMLAVCLHELGHCALGRCPGAAAHFDRRRRGVSACLACEQAAWDLAKTWHQFTPAMFDAMRRYFGTYRRGIPAPLAAMQKADETLGRVSALELRMKKLKFAEMVARNERARRMLCTKS